MESRDAETSPRSLLLGVGRVMTRSVDDETGEEEEDQNRIEKSASLTYHDILARNQESLSTFTNLPPAYKHFVDSHVPHFQRVIITPSGKL